MSQKSKIVIDLTQEKGKLLISIDIGLRNCAIACVDVKSKTVSKLVNMDLFGSNEYAWPEKAVPLVAKIVDEICAQHNSEYDIEVCIEKQLLIGGNRNKAVVSSLISLETAFGASFHGKGIKYSSIDVKDVQRYWKLPSQRKEKKVAAINKVRELIEVGITVPEYILSSYNTSRKKDDMADALLEAIYVINNKF